MFICEWRRNIKKKLENKSSVGSVGTIASDFCVTAYLIIGCGLCIKTMYLIFVALDANEY